MRRIERLINLIAALLEARRPLTAEEIRRSIAGYGQEDFDTFRRAFERDKEALRAIGIPLEVTATDPWSDRPDGYVISKSKYYLPSLDLEPDELAALSIAADAILGAGEAAESGILKLSIGSVGGVAGGRRIVWGADVAAEQPLLASLYEALLDRRAVTFPYPTSAADETAERTLETYALSNRGGHWYAVGRDADRDAIRAFKVGRIAGAARALEDRYDIPEGFDAAAHLGGAAWETGPDEPTAAVVRFDETQRWWAEQNLPDTPAREAPEGALDLELRVTRLDALISWTIERGPGVTIIAPAVARQRMLDHLAPYLERAS